jgi:hypothetical protein
MANTCKCGKHRVCEGNVRREKKEGVTRVTINPDTANWLWVDRFYVVVYNTQHTTHSTNRTEMRCVNHESSNSNNDTQLCVCVLSVSRRMKNGVSQQRHAESKGKLSMESKGEREDTTCDMCVFVCVCVCVILNFFHLSLLGLCFLFQNRLSSSLYPGGKKRLNPMRSCGNSLRSCDTEIMTSATLFLFCAFERTCERENHRKKSRIREPKKMWQNKIGRK